MYSRAYAFIYWSYIHSLILDHYLQSSVGRYSMIWDNWCVSSLCCRLALFIMFLKMVMIGRMWWQCQFMAAGVHGSFWYQPRRLKQLSPPSGLQELVRCPGCQADASYSDETGCNVFARITAEHPRSPAMTPSPPWRASTSVSPSSSEACINLEVEYLLISAGTCPI
jgi:hypothetical protein